MQWLLPLRALLADVPGAVSTQARGTAIPPRQGPKRVFCPCLRNDGHCLHSRPQCPVVIELTGRPTRQVRALTRPVALESRCVLSEHAGPLGALRQVDAGLLNVGYVDAGVADGPVVLLLHGWPYDIHSYAAVVPLLAAAGHRVI